LYRCPQLSSTIVKRVADWAKLNCGQCVTKHGNKCAQGPYCQHFFLHKFRHTFATEHLRHGVDIRTLQTWMGHRDIKSTMVYLKGVQSEDALAKVNAGALAGMLPDQVELNQTLRLCWFSIMKRKHPELPDRYDAFLQELKERIRSAQVRAALADRCRARGDIPERVSVAPRVPHLQLHRRRGTDWIQSFERHAASQRIPCSQRPTSHLSRCRGRS
jgi:hypothetical protein